MYIFSLTQLLNICVILCTKSRSWQETKSSKQPILKKNYVRTFNLRISYYNELHYNMFQTLQNILPSRIIVREVNTAQNASRFTQFLKDSRESVISNFF